MIQWSHQTIVKTGAIQPENKPYHFQTKKQDADIKHSRKWSCQIVEQNEPIGQSGAVKIIPKLVLLNKRTKIVH